MGISAKMLEKMVEAQVELVLWKHLKENSKGWCLRELAEHARLNPRETRALLKYQISVGVLVRVADALDASVDALLGRQVAQKPSQDNPGGWTPPPDRGTLEEIVSAAILSMPEKQTELFNEQRAMVVVPPAQDMDVGSLVEVWVDRFMPGLLTASGADPVILQALENLKTQSLSAVEAAFQWVWPLLYPLDLVPSMKWLQVAEAVAVEISSGTFDRERQTRYVSSYSRETSWRPSW